MWLGRPSTSSMEFAITSETIIKAMHHNAARIGSLSQNIGLFEWCVFAWLRKVRVIVHMGHSLIDVVARLLPVLQAAEHSSNVANVAFAAAVHVAWVKVTGATHDEPEIATPPVAASSAELGFDPDLNHWVFLHALPGASPSYVDEAKIANETYRSYLFRSNFLLVDTIAQGDCGMDCMAITEGTARTPQNWFHLRQELCKFSVEAAVVPHWRSAFILSGEMPDPKDFEAKPSKCFMLSQAIRDRIRQGYKRWSKTKSTSEIIQSATPTTEQDSTTETPVKPTTDETMLAICWSTGCSNNKLETMPVVRKAALSMLIDEMDLDSMHQLVEAWKGRPQQQIATTPKTDVQIFSSVGGGARRSYRGTRLSVRIAMGRACKRFFASPEGVQAQKGHCKWLAAARHFGLVQDNDPEVVKKRQKDLVKRCLKAAEVNKGSASRQLISETSRGKTAPAWMVTHVKHRFRRRGLQGRPQKNPEISHALYQWFVDVRGIARSRLRPRLVLAQAQIMQQSINNAKMHAGLQPTPVVLDRKWLSAWCHKWGASLKQPNKRYKVKHGQTFIGATFMLFEFFS